MFRTRGHLAIKLSSIFGLILITTLSTGCATRVLMSSDRYEKPEADKPQFQSSHQVSNDSRSDFRIENTYLAALNAKALR